jgi:uncharacterized membrane protein YjjB (DUF3815 family)
MEPRAYVVIFGSLAVCVAAVVFGVVWTSPWAKLLLVAGIVACVAWVVVAFFLANAMNSDI